jgi:hypothetical protein
MGDVRPWGKRAPDVPTAATNAMSRKNGVFLKRGGRGNLWSCCSFYFKNPLILRTSSGFNLGIKIHFFILGIPYSRVMLRARIHLLQTIPINIWAQRNATTQPWMTHSNICKGGNLYARDDNTTSMNQGIGDRAAGQQRSTHATRRVQTCNPKESGLTTDH